jgi:hypothetical protein
MMLAHQLAAAHKVAMKLAGRAAMHATNAEHDGFGPEMRYPGSRLEFHAVEADRAAKAMARVMEAWQHGYATLMRVRSAGRQTVVVQHVNVASGSQAVVAGGNVKGGRQGKPGRADLKTTDERHGTPSTCSRHVILHRRGGMAWGGFLDSGHRPSGGHRREPHPNKPLY